MSERAVQDLDRPVTVRDFAMIVAMVTRMTTEVAYSADFLRRGDHEGAVAKVDAVIELAGRIQSSLEALVYSPDDVGG